MNGIEAVMFDLGNVLLAFYDAHVRPDGAAHSCFSTISLPTWRVPAASA
jgi:hypothetical protein